MGKQLQNETSPFKGYSTRSRSDKIHQLRYLAKTDKTINNILQLSDSMLKSKTAWPTAASLPSGKSNASAEHFQKQGEAEASGM